MNPITPEVQAAIEWFRPVKYTGVPSDEHGNILAEEVERLRNEVEALETKLQAAEATVKELRADIERMDQWQHNAKCLFKVVEDELVSATWQKLKSNDVKYTQLQIKTLINQL